MVEIIPKPPTKLPPWLNILFYFSLFLFLAILVSFFILGNSLKNYRTELGNLEKAITEQKTPEVLALEQEVSSYQKKIADFSLLFQNHLAPSNLLKFLEEISHPKVWFSQFSLNSSEGQLTLTGYADSFLSVGQQLLTLKEKPLIENFSLPEISISKKGEVVFILNLFLDPKIFNPTFSEKTE